MQNRVFLGCEAPEMFPLWASRSSSKFFSCQFLPWICGFSISLKPPELPREAARADPKLLDAMSNASSAPSLCVRLCPLSLQGQQGGMWTALVPDLRVPPQRDGLSPPCSVARAFVHSARSDAGLPCCCWIALQPPVCGNLLCTITPGAWQALLFARFLPRSLADAFHPRDKAWGVPGVPHRAHPGVP